jgi:SAM-dependent methyltransferase
LAVSIRRDKTDVQEVVTRLLNGRTTVTALEAGCGSASYVDLGGAVHLVGIDISERQLERNDLLKQRIRGDIQTYPLEPSSFDAVICWEVLEHVASPARALANFFQATKPDGIVVIAVPNVLSIKGLITKLSPHWFHVWFYRHVFGIKDAGRDDRAPFRTVLSLQIAPQALRRFAETHGFAVEYLYLYESWQQAGLRRKLGVVGPVWAAVRILVRGLTLGKVSPEYTDLVAVFRRRPQPAGS